MQSEINSVKTFESIDLKLKMKYFILNDKVIGPAEVINHGIKRNIYFCYH